MIYYNFSIIEGRATHSDFQKHCEIMQKHQKYRINPKVSLLCYVLVVRRLIVAFSDAKAQTSMISQHFGKNLWGAMHAGSRKFTQVAGGVVPYKESMQQCSQAF